MHTSIPMGETHTSEPTSSTGRRTGIWLLPLALLIGFGLLFLLLFRDRILPAREVEAVPAIGIEETSQVNPTDTTTRTGKLLFQASGWIEPDPQPIKATALTDGIVEEVHVLEGELVKKGDLLASLIGIDTRLIRDDMQARLEDEKASFDAHCTGTQLAIQRMEVEKANLTIAQADLEEAQNKQARYRRISKGSITEDERIAVRLDETRAEAMVAATNAKIGGIAQELNKIAYEILAIQARIRRAEIELEKAELAHSRTKITAPADGRVLALLAAPGQKKMANMDSEDSSTIAILYDPAHLQVRVDVPLGDASGLSVGQRTKIRCSLLPDEVFDGVVTRIEGAADLQRNTLQAKVRIEDPSEKLRPEMLSRVEFFETSQLSSQTESTSIAVYVPQSALTNGHVWICDADSLRAEKRSVESSATAENLVRIDSGIRPGEWIITNPSDIKTGQRLKPIFSN